MRELVLCFDLEQDDIQSPAAAMWEWRGAHGALAWWHEEREQWPAQSNINWFVRTDLQVAGVLGDAAWPLRALSDELADLLADGDSLGAHPHLYRDGAAGWRNDYADIEHAWECARVAIDAFVRETGAPCTTFRWGDRVEHQALWGRLADHGVRFDLSAEPDRVGLPPRDGGAGAQSSFVGRSREPFETVEGMVVWPVSTYSLRSITPPPTGCIARAPLGYTEAVDDQWVYAWCRDTDDAGARVDVELLIDGIATECASAAWYRADLLAAGEGDGFHGVRIAMRDEWRDLPIDAFSMRACGHDLMLGSWRDHRSARGEEASVLTLSVDSEPEQFDRALCSLLKVPGTALTIATRSEGFVDDRVFGFIRQNAATLLAKIREGVLSPPRTLAVAHSRL